jgi:hypothetical protein
VLLDRVHVGLADAALRPWQRNLQPVDRLEETEGDDLPCLCTF